MYFLQVAKPVVFDLLATILFALAFFVAHGVLGATAIHSVYAATIVGIGIGVAQLVYKKAFALPIGPLQWLSLLIVTALGGMTLVTHNPVFIKLKPTVIDFAVGVFMASRDWISPYLPQFVKDNVSAKTVARANYGWAALMLGFAAVNVFVAFTAEFWVWLVYATFVPTAIIAALFVVQYFTFDAMARRNQRARLAAQAA